MILLLKIAKRNGGRKIARKLRDWYPGAIYHIMHRGVRRKPIFEDEMDHQVLLQIIKTSLSKYNCWLHADHIGVRPHEIHIKKIKQNQKFYKRNIKYLVKAYHK